ncbi:MAG: hypothetical protein HY537_00695 [Deltaproteobacteria bacterium]|nr:hypothetical protein [Deltaproteobacteria bacterium]
MKVFTFRYESNPTRKAFARMRKAIETGIPDIHEDEIVCDSLDSMLKLMSKSRFEVFAGIVEHRPESLYELAKSLSKDQGNVLKEVKALEALGLISLTPSKEGERERLKPKALYDKIIFEFEPKKAAKTG